MLPEPRLSGGAKDSFHAKPKPFSIERRFRLMQTGSVAIFKSGQYDLVLCDLKMPEQNGLEILLSLKEKRPDLASQFLLMTGNLADTEKLTVELSGIPILPKPFTLARLRETVKSFLSKKLP